MKRNRNDIFGEISKEVNISKTEIEKVFNCLIKFIKYKIETFDLSCIHKEEDFKKIRNSFNLKYLGKFSINFKNFKYINKWKK